MLEQQPDSSQKAPNLKSLGTIILGVLLSGFAVLGNVLNVDTFFGVNFLFGGVLSWITLLLLGPRWGLCAVVAASLYTVNLWGHWYAFILFTSEFVFVASLSRKKSISRIIGLVSIYWLAFGGPAAMLFYRFFLNLPWETVSVVVAKQALNAIVNICLALLLYYAILLLKFTFDEHAKIRGSFTNFLQILFLSCTLIPLSAYEFYIIKRQFNGVIDGIQLQEQIQLEKFSKNINRFLALENAHWVSMFDQMVTHANSRNLSDVYNGSLFAPISIYRVSNKTGEVALQFGEELPIIERLHGVPPIGPNDSIAQFLGCDGQRILSSYRSNSTYYIAWPLTLSNYIDMGLGFSPEHIKCSTDWANSNFLTQTKIEFEIERAKAPNIPTLQSWLTAKNVSSIEIPGTFPTIFEHTVSLRDSVVRTQEAIKVAVTRLAVLAYSLVLLSYLLNLALVRRFDKFTKLVEVFLSDREINQNVLNLAIEEDRAIYDTVVRLENTFSQEEVVRKNVVKSFTQLVEESSSPIFATDEKGIIQFWNKSLEDLSGYARDELIGMPFKRIASIDIERKLEEDGRKTHLEFEFSINSKDGKLINLKASQTIVRDLSALLSPSMSGSNDKGSLHFFIAIDETETLNARVHMVHMSRLAALGEMSSAFAHELSQPLNVISMAAGNSVARLNMGSVPSSYLKEKISRIEMQAARAGEIIRNIREFSSVKHSETSEVFDPVLHCKTSLDLIKEQLRLDSIAVEFFDDSQGALIEGRPILFEQIIVNVVNNARQAMIENHSSKRICKINLSSNDGYLTIEISDTGSGFTKDSLKMAFDPFFTTKPENIGTGIGLYMCKTIVNAMRGEILALNSNKGGVISMRFPISTYSTLKTNST